MYINMTVRHFLLRNRDFFYRHTHINYRTDAFDASIVASKLLKWFDRMSRKSQLMKVFFNSVSEFEYENIIIKFFNYIPHKNITMSVINMFCQFDKIFFTKEYLKYINTYREYYGKKYNKMIALEEYSHIQNEIMKQIILMGREMNSIKFTSDKVSNEIKMNTINDMNRFVINTAIFYNRYKILSSVYDRFFIHVTVNMRTRREKEREFKRKQKNIVRCEILSKKLPRDICLHIICNYL